MRKILGKVIVLAAMAALLLTATAAAADTGVVNVDSLRMRSEPSTDSTTLTYLNSGTQVQVLEDLDDWYQISWGGYTGYVSADYLDYSPVVSSTSVPAAPVPMDQAVIGQLGTITGAGVNFRATPSTSAQVYSILNEGDQLTVVSLDGEWCEMDLNGLDGYVNADYVSVNGLPLVDPQGIVTGDCVNVRSAPTTEASIITKVYAGTVVDLINLENDWYAVNCNGTAGYIRSDYLRIYDGSEASELGASIVETALEYLGVPYSYGGSSPKGFDCSGFTMYVYSQYGYSLPHSATSQWNNSGSYVAREDLQPGDLVLFCDPALNNGKACSHVGIYIGDNEFVHAASGYNSGRRVRISNLDESYYSRYYVGAKRVA